MGVSRMKTRGWGGGNNVTDLISIPWSWCAIPGPLFADRSDGINWHAHHSGRLQTVLGVNLHDS